MDHQPFGLPYALDLVTSFIIAASYSASISFASCYLPSSVVVVNTAGIVVGPLAFALGPDRRSCPLFFDYFNY